MRRSAWAIVPFLLSGFLSASPAETKETPLAAANTAFALDLHRKVRGDGNAFFSPVSISDVLAMAWAGAKGETARQIANVLHLPAAGDEPWAAFRERRQRIEAVQDLSLVVLLPMKTGGLSAVEDMLTPARLSEWLQAMGGRTQAVDVTLPRFRMEAGFTLRPCSRRSG